MRKSFLLLLLMPLLLTGCSTSSSTNNQSTSQKTEQTEKQTPSATKSQASVSTAQMSTWTYQTGENPVKVINNDQPTTIKATDFQTSHIDYGGLDNLNRTKTATAYLTRNNLGKSDTRTEQVWRPTGWHNQPKYVDGQRVIAQNRGHLIAYTMTFNLNKDGQTAQGQLGSIDNPYNLFTQTAFSNQQTMTQTEQMVRDALAQNKKVVYQVTPIFRNNELMARGVWVQAISNDGSLKFNRYLWNVQNKVQFDYATGRSTVNDSLTVPAVENNQRTYQKHNNHHYYRHRTKHYYHRYK